MYNFFFFLQSRLISQSIWWHEAKNLYNLKNKQNYLYAKNIISYITLKQTFFVLNETFFVANNKTKLMVLCMPFMSLLNLCVYLLQVSPPVSGEVSVTSPFFKVECIS